MTTTETRLDTETAAFVEEARKAADKAFDVFRKTGTVAANGTVNFVERVPGTEIAVALNDPGPWANDPSVSPVVATFDGEVLSGNGSAGFVTGYASVFRQHPEITSVVHIHTPWLGGWAQTHRTLPIRYAASQRLTLSREIPPHIDRSRSAGDFILERLEHDPDSGGDLRSQRRGQRHRPQRVARPREVRRPPRGGRTVPGDRRIPRRFGRIRSVQPRRAVGP